MIQSTKAAPMYQAAEDAWANRNDPYRQAVASQAGTLPTASLTAVKGFPPRSPIVARTVDRPRPRLMSLWKTVLRWLQARIVCTELHFRCSLPHKQGFR
jgi:hypothetical protein